MAMTEIGEYTGPRTFTSAITICLTDYAKFSGRAPRSEYWFFALFTALTEIAGEIIDISVFRIGHGSFSLLIQLALLIPSLAVLVRRLHDIDRGGWWCLIVLIPFIGMIVLLVWACTRGTAGPNRFGADPLAVTARPDAWSRRDG